MLIFQINFAFESAMFLLKAIEKVSNMFILLAEKLGASKIVLKRNKSPKHWNMARALPTAVCSHWYCIFCVQLFYFISISWHTSNFLKWAKKARFKRNQQIYTFSFFRSMFLKWVMRWEKLLKCKKIRQWSEIKEEPTISSKLRIYKKCNRSIIRSIFWLKIKIQRWHSDIVIYILSYTVSYYIIYIVI